MCGKRRKFPSSSSVFVRQDEVFAGDWEIGNAVTVLQDQSPSTPTLKPQQQGNQDHSSCVVCGVFARARGNREGEKEIKVSD